MKRLCLRYTGGNKIPRMLWLCPHDACQTCRRTVDARDADALTSAGCQPRFGYPALKDFLILNDPGMSSPALSNGTKSERIARVARLSRYARHLLSANPA